mmetsp:Transcript_5151/g.16863  ORF Transcript_5151/g.16863 Transcript_5151/m.16863 type:complete len:269 (+) Transcript_5151:321-1127(+)
MEKSDRRQMLKHIKKEAMAKGGDCKMTVSECRQLMKSAKAAAVARGEEQERKEGLVYYLAGLSSELQGRLLSMEAIIAASPMFSALGLGLGKQAPQTPQVPQVPLDAATAAAAVAAAAATASSRPGDLSAQPQNWTGAAAAAGLPPTLAGGAGAGLPGLPGLPQQGNLLGLLSQYPGLMGPQLSTAPVELSQMQQLQQLLAQPYVSPSAHSGRRDPSDALHMSALAPLMNNMNNMYVAGAKPAERARLEPQQPEQQGALGSGGLPGNH